MVRRKFGFVFYPTAWMGILFLKNADYTSKISLFIKNHKLSISDYRITKGNKQLSTMLWLDSIWRSIFVIEIMHNDKCSIEPSNFPEHNYEVIIYAEKQLALTNKFWYASRIHCFCSNYHLHLM